MLKKKVCTSLMMNFHQIIHDKQFRPLRMTILILLGFQLLLISTMFVFVMTNSSNVFAVTLADDNQTDFDAGTYSDTNFANGGVELNATGKTNGTGVYTSNIKDASAISSWDTVAWTPDRPSGKALPSNASVETAYNTGNADMSGNLLLMHMDDASGSIVDSSGNLNSGTNNGGSYSASGKINTSLSFGGNGDLVESNSYTYTFGSALTFAAWFKYSGPGIGSPRILEVSKTGDADSHALAPDPDGSLRAWAECNNGTRVASADDGADYDDGDWHYMVYTYSNPTGIIYVDGVQTATASGSCSNLDDGAYLAIGAISDGDGTYTHSQHEFDGSIDEVAIWDRALSSGEVLDFYKRGALNVKYQLRSCDDSSCSGESFVGPDGTASTYYSEASNTGIGLPSFSISNVISNQYFQYQATFETDNSSYTSNVSSVTLDYTYINAPPSVSVNSAVQRSDATGIIDISVEIDDALDEDVKLLVEYESDSDGACNGPWVKTTLDESSGVTADTNDSGGSPSVVNSDAYQIGTTASRNVVTSSGANTITFDWNSSTDLPSANETRCLRFTGNDGLSDTTPAVTYALSVNNASPVISDTMVSPSSGSVENGEIVTVTLTAGESGLTTDGCNVNTEPVGSNFTDNSDGTYTLLYVPISGHASWSAGNLPINCTLKDSGGNTGSTSAFTDANTLEGIISASSGGSGTSCPQISNTVFNINDGDTTTAVRDVELSFSANNASLVIFSENQLFNDTSFGPLVNTADFTLSEDEGVKTIFAQYKSDCATGIIFSSSINFEIPPEGSIAAEKLAEEAAAEAAETGDEEELDDDEVIVDDLEEGTEETLVVEDTKTDDGGTGGPNDIVLSPSAGVDEEVGGFIVVEAMVRDDSPTGDTFSSTLTNGIDDFYNGSVLSFSTGELAGESRVVFDYIGETRTIILSSGFAVAPKDEDRFNIVKQNLTVEIPTLEEITQLLADEGIFIEDIGFSEELEADIFKEVLSVSNGLTRIYQDVTVNELPLDSSQISRDAIEELLTDESDRLESIFEDIELTNINTATLDELLKVDSSDVQGPRQVQSKVAGLQAINSLVKRILESDGREPIIESYMSWGSLQLNFLAANPLPIPIEVAFQSELPRELVNVGLVQVDGLEVNYDPDLEVYIVREEVLLQPGEVLVRSLRMQDVWLIDEEQLSHLLLQAELLLTVLEDSSYFVQGLLIEGRIKTAVDLIRAEQLSIRQSPQQHILLYRKNLQRVLLLDEDLAFFQSLVDITAQLRLEEKRVENSRIILATVLSGLVFFLLIVALIWYILRKKKKPGSDFALAKGKKI